MILQAAAFVKSQSANKTKSALTVELSCAAGLPEMVL
jgi:hypothetical protein